MPALENAGTIERLLDAVQARLPGIMLENLRAAIWDTIEDFCARSSYFAQSVTWSGSATVTVAAPANTKIYRIIEVYGPAAYTVEQPNRIILHGGQQASGSVLVALCPLNLDATPAVLLSTWFEAFYEGTLARLYSEPAKPYSNKETVEFFTARFEKYIEQAALQAPRGVAATTTQSGSLGRLYASLRADLGDVPHAVLQQVVWDTINDYCARSGDYSTVVTWTESNILGDMVTLPAPVNTIITEIREIYDLSLYTIEQPDVIRLLDPQSRIGTALIIMIPDSLATTPASLLVSCFDVLRDGALARLYGDAGRPYANKESAAFYTDRYEKRAARALLQAERFVTDVPARTNEIERLYMEIKATLGFEVPQTILRQAAWNTIEDFYLQSTLRREHVYWQMGPYIQTVEFDPFDTGSRVAWILNYSGLIFGKVEMPSRLRDLTSPTPASTRQGEAWLALKPASFAALSGCDSAFGELWTHWFEAISAGVLHRLCLQPAKPWSSSQLALIHGRGYRRGVQIARSTAMRGYSAGAPVPFPYFAGGRRHFGSWSVR